MASLRNSVCLVGMMFLQILASIPTEAAIVSFSHSENISDFSHTEGQTLATETNRLDLTTQENDQSMTTQRNSQDLTTQKNSQDSVVQTNSSGMKTIQRNSNDVATEVEPPEIDSTEILDDLSSMDSELMADFNNTFQNLTTNDENPKSEKKKDILGMVMEPIFFTTGIVGNSLSIRVLLGKDFRAMHVSLALVCLAFSDMAVTIMHPFNRPFFREIIQIDIRSINGHIGCKIFYWSWKTAKMTSSWFVVFVCIERFLVVWFPLKVKQISTRKNTIIGLILIYLGIGSFNAVWSFSSGLKNGKTCVPDMKEKGLEEVTKIFLLCGTTLYSLLPSTLMICFTTLTASKLLVSRKQRKKMSADRTSSQDSATVRVTAMLIGITIAYVLLVNPHAIFHNIAFLSGKDFFETTSPMIKTGREISQVLEQINYSINFFLYVLCSAQFRGRIAEILGLRKCTGRDIVRKTSTSTTKRTVTSQASSAGPPSTT